MAGDNNSDFVLGIDLGTNSLGWAVLEREGGAPVGVRAAGARVFESAMDGDIESGREESRNKARRDARLQRRQAWRRRRRRKKVFRLLQQCGLLPAGEGSTPEQRQNLLNHLDRSILATPWFAAKKAAAFVVEPLQVLPYLLRSLALDGPLEPHLIGRALYHLAQRRGFLSNRRETSASKKKGKDDDDEGKVASDISDLRKQMDESGARTLGEYFSRLNPHEARIRTRYTHRTMYEEEFNQIWNAQSRHHPALLTEERRKELYKAIFFQRPLWFPRGLVGRCELETVTEERRAPAYHLVSQRFRLLQKVNDLKIRLHQEVERYLTAEERNKLLDTLEEHGDLTFSQMRRLLDLPKNCKFNLEVAGEEKIPGNRTASKFREVFGPRWLSMSTEEQSRAVAYVHGLQRPDKLKLDGVAKKWGLDPAAAENLVEIALEGDYLNHSVKAMKKLLPLMESGSPYSDARKQEYPQSFAVAEPLPLLPPVVKGLSEVRNPAVTRSLTELRKVVNAVIRAHGKPAEIRIELARDLRKTKKQRENTWKRGRENQNTREVACKKLKDWGLPKPSRDDITKVMLAEECGWKCPYTGKTISMDSLFGAHPQFDLEHILPFRRSLDNSFVNLTLCQTEENHKKGRRTPQEAYSADAARYREILGRVKQFRYHAAHEKRRRFKMTPEEFAKHLQDFSARQLNDTRYASRLAADYLALLYGGRVDTSGKLRIRSSAGQVTFFLRDEWKLNSILRDGPTSDGGSRPKSRDDHRHHAVDAVVIALTDDGTIARLQRAAELAPAERRRRFASLQAPWPDFVDSIRAVIGRIVVSHRVSRKVSGALHEETFYSGPMRSRTDKKKKGGEEEVRHVRKLLASLTKNEAEDIVDDAVRRLVLEKLKALGASEPKKVFSDEKNLPFLKAANGRRIPIKRVRVKKAVPAFVVGSGPSARHVTSESNHHVEIFAELDEGGAEVRWEGAVVSMFEAYRRQRARLPIVQRDHGPATAFKFSLSPGDIIDCDGTEKRHRLLAVRGVSQAASGQIQIAFVNINDARKKADIVAAKHFFRPVPDTLRNWNARKVSVGPLGEVTEAHD